MTPQSFSYGVVGQNEMIYLPPYGLNESLNYMLKLNPDTHEIKKILLDVDKSFEKWIWGISHENKIYFLPYGESKILIVDTDNDKIRYVHLDIKGHGKYAMGHLFNNKIIALPHGDLEPFDHILVFDVINESVILQEIQLDINDTKKWHTSQLLDNIIYAMPRGDRKESPYFPYRIEYNCDTLSYTLHDLSAIWSEIDTEEYAGAKYTTLAQCNGKLYAPPYGRNSKFDIMAIFKNNSWKYFSTEQKQTSRKYYTNIVSNNGKIYFPPAGHEENWSQLMIVDSRTDEIKIKDLGIEKESKKYFAGVENSQGKIYFLPRGGCVCEPEETWKTFGDLTEILVINTIDDTTYTIDVSEHYNKSTTIEKYNSCIIYNDKIFALPYGESNDFQEILVFDTINETVIEKINLDEL